MYYSFMSIPYFARQNVLLLWSIIKIMTSAPKYVSIEETNAERNCHAN